jgi:hypothetical protein
VAGGHDGREPGGAEPVDRHARDRLWEACEQSGHPGDIAIVLAGLVRGAEVDVLDFGRVHARSLDGFLDHESGEVVWTLTCDRASVPADGSSDSGEHNRAAHGISLAPEPVQNLSHS